MLSATTTPSHDAPPSNVALITASLIAKPIKGGKPACENSASVIAVRSSPGRRDGSSNGRPWNES